MTVLFADAALLPGGWARNVRLIVDGHGNIAAVEPGAVPELAERLAGPVLPGMPNLHSHAFQRAMAGLTEGASGTGDDFWSWRQTMYRFLAVLDPEDIGAIAAQLYVEMAKAGFTAVGEFHYLHHDRDASPYADRAVTGKVLIEAARDAGIGLTLLPTLYQANGFGGVAPSEGQRRFTDSVDGILRVIAGLRQLHPDTAQLRLGLTLHSLRAVHPDAVAEAVAGISALDPIAPIHIHVAEQTREVEECLEWCGRRTVEWLLYNAPIDRRWCLVHATHIDQAECAALAASGAVAGLCPTTEANLGDGFFPLPLTSSSTVCGASAPTATSPSARSRSCAGSNTARACKPAAALSRPRAHRARQGRSCGETLPWAARRPWVGRSVGSRRGAAPTSSCSTRMRRRCTANRATCCSIHWSSPQTSCRSAM